jgi:TolB-like protein
LNKRSAYKSILTMIFCIACLPLSAWAEPVRVAVLPFAIHSDKDYGFLQKGIVQMITSRISAPGKVEVIDPLSTEQAVAASQAQLSADRLAQAVGAGLKADFAIHGSITVLGESVSIDAKMLDLTGTRPPMTFFKQTQGMGDVIPQINLMATDINNQVFGVRPPDAPAPPVAAAPQAPAVDNVHRHPERLLQEIRPTPGPRAAGPTEGSATPHPLNPAFTQTRGMSSSGESEGFWKGRNYNHLINSIAVGDVTKDGLNETVVASPEKIHIYRFAQGQQQTIAEIEAGRFVRNISVDIADINGNGTAEIFVTAFSVGLNALQSYVLEYDGQRFRPIVENSRYYFNVIEHPILGRRLFGQQQISTESTPFDAPVFEMQWHAGEYAPSRQILPSRLGNVLGLAFGDILNDGSEAIAALNRDDFMRVLAPNGKVQWVSSDTYGGTTLYFALPPPTPGDAPYQFFLPTRVRNVDLDGNGKSEVLVASNQDSAGRKLEQRRFFGKGKVEALVWDGIGLASTWSTRELSGRVQDFLVADFNNDGVQNLLVAIVTKEGATILTDAQSSLVAFDLKAP